MPQFVVLRAAGEAYALPIEDVREIVGDAPRRALPGQAAPWIAGVASIRGDLMPIVDLGIRLGGAAADPRAHRTLVVLEAAGSAPAALCVERVDHIATVAEHEVAPAPAYAGPAAAGIAELGGELVVILRVSALLPGRGGI